jgi:putative addiction module component (TIGR02574 family)
MFRNTKGEVLMKLAQIEGEALKLDLQERANLVLRLLDSLDDGSPSDYDEDAWIAEAEHRYVLYKEGRIDSRDAMLVLRDAHQALQ